MKNKSLGWFEKKSGLWGFLSLLISMIVIVIGFFYDKNQVNEDLVPPTVAINSAKENDIDDVYLSSIIEALADLAFIEGRSKSREKIIKHSSSEQLQNNSISKSIITHVFYDTVKVSLMRKESYAEQNSKKIDLYVEVIRVENLKAWGDWKKIEYYCRYNRKDIECSFQTGADTQIVSLLKSLYSIGIEVEEKYLFKRAYEVSITDHPRNVTTKIVFDRDKRILTNASS